MYNELIELLSFKIDSYDIEIKEVNENIKEIKDLYDVLSRKNLKDSAKILKKNQNMTTKLYDIMEKYNKLSCDLLDKAIKLKEECDSKCLSNSIIDRKNLLYYQNSINLSQLEIENKKKELTRLCVKIVEYDAEFIINRYNALIEKKEEIKKEKKVYEYVKRNIKSNSMLIPRDIATLNNLIYDIKDDDKQKELFKLLNDYMLSHMSKISKQKDGEVKKKDIIYSFKDDEYEDKKTSKEYDNINRNYLIALRCFDNYNDICLFLDSIKDKFKIEKVIEKIINLLSLEEEKLKEYLIRYLNSNCTVVSNDIDDSKNSNIILFTGFLEKKNRILNDCIKKDIKEDYYQDIYKGLNIIKENGGEGKRQNIVKRKKIFKLRINSIRITYKRLSKNVYIILGVFKKDDRWGQHIIDTTIKRDKDLLLVEKSIIDSMNIKELWEEYVSQNNIMYEEIEKALCYKNNKTCLVKKKMI